MNTFRRAARLCGLCLLPLVTAQAAAAPQWRTVELDAIAAQGPRLIIPTQAHYLAVDAQALAAQLARAPHEFSAADAITLEVPMPDGQTQRFAVMATDLMHPDLAARYPEIRTYTGYGLDEPTASARFDMTPRGFHGLILSPAGTVYIDPVQRQDQVHYQSYWRIHAPDRGPRPADQVLPSVTQSGPLDMAARPAKARFAGSLRTYRLALAATGDYSHFQDPPPAPLAGLADKTLVLAEMVTAINRVVGIYERNFSVRMQLVANNDDVIFQHPLADPYVDGALTGLEGLPMLFTNTPVLNAMIGAENYDIGHVFSVGGGGVAQLGSVCGSSKGGGVTGLPQPVGDPFYVDYVAHEMGHQFGANHTFNGVSGACSGGNRNASTAYEPGSATTIMGYAGICGSDNIQMHSDDHFHGISFDEVVSFTDFAGGSVCGELTELDNRPPLARAGVGGFTIPARTPFVLTGEGSDPDGQDSLSYQWEQFDLGPAAPAGQAVEQGPLFRSYPPSTSPVRVFPAMADLAAGRETLGEVLPRSSRELRFRFTVRDNAPGGGGTANAMIKFAVSDAAGPFRIIAPAGGNTWAGGSSLDVVWDVANTDQPPVSCAAVDIALSRDGGLSYPEILLRQAPNDGADSVTLPRADIEKARIQVRCSDNIFFAISPADFSIGSPVQARAAADAVKGGGLGGTSLLLLALLLGGRRRFAPR